VADDLNPLTLGEIPEDFIENDDGSVDIPGMEPIVDQDSDFLVNLAEVLPESELTGIASELIDLIEGDKESRKKRDQQYEEGLRRTGLGEDAPGGAEFDGASRVVHPVLAEACVDFSSRAIKELFPASGPVKSWVIGAPDAKKLDRAERKTRFMNWQLTTQIEEYRAELEQLLTQLPMGGSQYQKFWRDDRKKRVCCEFVPIDEVFLPFAATNFYTAARVTHRQLITRAEFKRRVRSGLYRDVFVVSAGSYPEESLAQHANDKIEGREEDGYNEDGLRAVLEIYCWQELEGDNITQAEYAPYIITIDEDSEKVLSVYRNWSENDPVFEKLDWFVEWKFIPWRGAYAIGLPHLIGGLSAALTGSLRALLDSAHINNAPTMLKLKSGRVVGQNTQVNVTQVCDIEGPSNIDDIRKLAMAMPFNPPSPVLNDLMDKLYGLAKGVVATAEDKIGNVGDRTPVGTTMALIEQGSNTYSAIHARLHESQKKALAILHRLNSVYLDEENYIEDLGEVVVSREDFLGSMDVVPISDPTIFSEAQRFAQNQALMQMAQQDAQNPNIPWNQVAIRRRILKQMRIDNVDELLPAVKEPITSDILTENTQGLKGTPIKASQEQDHLAHIQGHLTFVASPLNLSNPLVSPQLLNTFFAHIEEHIQMLIAAVTEATAQQLAMAMPGASQDQVLVQATAQTQAMLAQQIAPILQQIAQAQQQLQQRMPPPQLPPEVQASIQIAQMDTQRKTAYDQGLLQLKTQELAQRGQMDGAKLQAAAQTDQSTQQLEFAQFQADTQNTQFEQSMTQREQEFNEYLRQLSQQNEQLKEQLRQETEIRKNLEDNQTRFAMNAQDNAARSDTNLEMNTEDNITKMIIAELSPNQANQP
jgi:hypothetical protein